MRTTADKRKYRTKIKIISYNKSNRLRLIVFRSNKNIYAQLIDHEGTVILESSSIKISKKNLTGIEKAKSVGESIAELCKKNKIEKIIFDKSSYMYSGRIKHLADACRENGIQF